MAESTRIFEPVHLSPARAALLPEKPTVGQQGGRNIDAVPAWRKIRGALLA